MTPGPVNLKIVSDRVTLARGYLADLEALKLPGAEAFARELEAAAARLAQNEPRHTHSGSD